MCLGLLFQYYFHISTEPETKAYVSASFGFIMSAFIWNVPSPEIRWTLITGTSVGYRVTSRQSINVPGPGQLRYS